MDVFESAVFDVGVDLGGGDAGVSEEFLEGSDFRSVGEHVGGEAVSEGVGADLVACSDADGVLFDESPEHFAGHLFSSAGDEEPTFVLAFDHVGSFEVEVFFEAFNGEGIEVHHAFLVSFSEASTEGLFDLEVAEFQTDQFGSAAACSVEHGEDGAVAERVAVFMLWCGKELDDPFGAEDFGEFLIEFG